MEECEKGNVRINARKQTQFNHHEEPTCSYMAETTRKDKIQKLHVENMHCDLWHWN